MHESISLKIPSDLKFMRIVEDLIRDTCDTLPLTPEDIMAIIESARELIENAVIHAYKDSPGYIQISLHPFKTGLRIDVHDWGLPMSLKKHISVPIKEDASEGFNRVYGLMDLFEYQNLGKDGKKFVIIKYASHPLHEEEAPHKALPALSERKREKRVEEDNIPVAIREFQEGDEEGIARLVFKNYGYSYIKDLFYYPHKVFESHGKKFYSIIAQREERIIGHFALVLVPESTVAEIGVAVVDPEFQGRGIMNKMLKLILKKARDIHLDAVFGEAIMFHIYSQKANLSHGFSEAGLMLGKVPVDTTIVNNKLAKKCKRGAVLVGYYFFNKMTKKLFLPNIYKKQIKRIYKNADVPFVKAKVGNEEILEHVFLSYTFDPPTNIAKIRVDRYGKDFKQKFIILLNQLKAKHCDMIYADISLEMIPQIDTVVKFMNKRGFFYSGVMFFYHERGDYLRLQLKHSDKIGSRNYVCYSDFCKKLSRFIQKDEQRVKKH
ncbi:GNAT family N-acetyltransferase [Sulfurovum sp.]|uniref:GNAT family N-acetyltransferase n=1 Tax=Sulfurovum sp. TaxID=1969726 RepID=UPI0025EF1A33|nr:GNAT family N-acetyltransferase [Sulfurovum sp.]